MIIQIITQCRLTSSRLPGKILLPLGKRTVLGQHIHRLQQTGLSICIATTTNSSDDALCAVAESSGVKITRGSENDVLQRFVDVQKKYPADWIIRVTSDCPFIDSGLILRGIELLDANTNPHTYISNCFPRTYARGFDFEIFHSSALLEAAEMSQDPFDREHVTPYLWKNKNGKIKMHNIAEPNDESQWRICIDTPEDYQLCSQLEERFGASELTFDQIHSIMKQYPSLGEINAHVEQKKS